MHCFSSPDCVEPSQTWVFSQFPKRTCGRMVGRADSAIEGWGVHFQEGWDWSAIWNILIAFFILPSAMFVALWSAFRHDLQSASGVAGYWIGVGTVFLCYVAAKGN